MVGHRLGSLDSAIQGLVLAVACAMLVVRTMPVAAQSVAHANIRGHVTDETGAALPGVTVTATSPALIVSQVSVTTDVEGAYVLPELPIGEYRLTYELQGFQRLAREQIILTAGFTAELNVNLKIGSVAETITVVGSSPIVDTTSTTPSVSLSAKVLTEVLPVTRRIQDILATTPGISSRFAADLGGGTTGGGAYTNYGITGQSTMLLEGVNTRQDATIDQGTGNSPDIGSLEEMQVVTVGGNAEQALPGVFLNMIVKSGSNAFHGRYEAQGVHDRFQSGNLTPSLRSQGINTSDAFKQSGELSGDLGGRIIKDKLWFYTAARYRKAERTTLGFAKAPGPDGVYQTADDEPGIRIGIDQNRTAKGTYQLANKYKVIGFYAIHTEEFDPYPFGDRLNPYESTLVFNWDPHQAKAEVQGAPSNRFLFNFLVGRQRYNAKYATQPSAPDAPRRFDTVTQLNLGPNHGQDRRPRESWGPSGSISFFPPGSALGRHELKAGFHSMLQTYATGRPNAKHGNYDLMFTRGVPFQLRTYNYPLTPKNQLNEGGAFVQDTWRIGERTTFNLGLRWDTFRSWVPAQTKEQGQFGNAGSFPEVEAIAWREWAPRIGVAYDLFGDGKTVLKATWGRYNHSPGDAFGESYNKNTISTTTYRWSDPNGNGDYDPGEVNLDTNGPDFINITAATNNLLPVGLVDPRSYESTVTLDRELKADFGARVSYIYIRQAKLYQAINVLRPYELWNVAIPRLDPGPDGLERTADDGGIVNVFDYLAAYRGSNFVGNQRLNRPGDQDSKLYTIEGVLTKRTTGKWGMLASVSGSKNDRFVSGIAATPNDDYFPKDTTWDWQIKVTGNYELPYSVSFAATYQIYNGIKGQRTNQFVNIPSASSVTLRLEEYGTRTGPARDLLNLRAARDFAISRARLRASVDVLNALNAANPWNMSFASGPTFLQWTTIDSPRIVRGGVTFIF